MRALRQSIPLIAVIALLGQAATLQAEVRPSGVAGRVLGETRPLVSAHIYAYQLADLTLHKVLTDAQGNFTFQDLPAGLYKIIAHKAGFLPAVIMITRTTAQAYQFLELQLAQRQAGQGPDSDDFWSIRARVPADVLRDIEAEESRIQLASFTARPMGSISNAFQTEMQALTGVDGMAAEGGKLSAAGVGFKGQVGQVEVGLHGRFTQLNNAAALQTGVGGASGTGQASSLAIDLTRGPGSRISIMSLNNRMTARGESGDGLGPVDFEHYQVNWSQDVGENGRSEFAAHYTSENNFHNQGSINPLDIPETSTSWRLEGAYTIDFSDRNTLQSGLRYRERQFGLGALDRPGKAYERQALSSVDLFSRGGIRVQPAVLMEYGLYSTLSDGSLALTPQGGIVLQLGSNWQVETTAAHRLYTDNATEPDFLPTLFEQRDLCEQGSESCYQVNFTRNNGDDNTLTLGAVHRTVGDTLRLYFSDDFFDRQESLYLVRGDKLPEIRFGFRHKISPRVVTTLDTSVAAGGSGMFFGANNQTYENQVRYLVTSLDTQLLASSTGIFVAFHHLEQQLDRAGVPGGRTASEMEYE
ncbi:MAG TPA: carboxypeptidase-like regulatory domain-containing protein, partial [Gemmatimonadales bacterium]|nr:carboxypeptidase-like regulatory domain-containing protein [Gemmatimonadales bacterium]